jgi:methylmalonyl-CoA mutase
LIDEVEAMGGMTEAVTSGVPKRRIEESATRRQARVDRGEEVMVGVNRYQSSADTDVDILNIDNSVVRNTQLGRLEQVRNTRDENRCQQALTGLTEATGQAGANLLEYALEAARARATVGEISLALEQVFGRHQAQIGTISGVYGEAYQGDEKFGAIRSAVADFARDAGRRPRILVAKLGQDGHDRGARVIATAFADIGFDVDIGPLFQTPEEVVRQAIDNDVHVIGISSQAGSHDTLVPQVIEALDRHQATEIIVVLGGVVPTADRQRLASLGVAAFYGPGTNIPQAAQEVLNMIQRSRA